MIELKEGKQLCYILIVNTKVYVNMGEGFDVFIKDFVLASNVQAMGEYLLPPDMALYFKSRYKDVKTCWVRPEAPGEITIGSIDGEIVVRLKQEEEWKKVKARWREAQLKHQKKSNQS